MHAKMMHFNEFDEDLASNREIGLNASVKCQKLITDIVIKSAET